MAEFNVQKNVAKEMEQSGRNGNKYWRFTGSGGEFSKKRARAVGRKTVIVGSSGFAASCGHCLAALARRARFR